MAHHLSELKEKAWYRLYRVLHLALTIYLLWYAWGLAEKATKRFLSTSFTVFQTIIYLVVALLIAEIVRRAFFYVISGKFSIVGERTFVLAKKFWYILIAIIVILGIGYGIGQWRENDLQVQKKSKSQINRTIKLPTNPNTNTPTNNPNNTQTVTP